MTGDKAVELINEWLNLAKEIGDMNLNRMEYDEEIKCPPSCSSNNVRLLRSIYFQAKSNIIKT